MIRLRQKEVDALRALPYEELIALSNEKNKRGCATKDALKAQQLIWEDNGEQFRGRSEWRED